MSNQDKLLYILKVVFIILLLLLVLLSLFLVKHIFNIGNKEKKTINKVRVIERKYDVNNINNVIFNFKNFEVKYIISNDEKIVVKQKGKTNKFYVDGKKNNKVLNIEESILDIFDKKTYKIYIPKKYTGKIKIINGFGNIEISKINNLELENNSGNVRIKDAKTINLVNVSGNVIIKGKTDRVVAYSTTGDLIISKLGSSCNIETITGDININNFRVSDYSRVESTSGNITLKLSKNSNCRLDYQKNDTHQIKNNKCINGENELKVKNVTGNIVIK
ncbi:MAG: DUF4097 family beta strand repeat protein [Bacilli bacterium]|nr:DUF4097 family beta strand repeat protein [Bacilli bacterium]